MIARIVSVIALLALMSALPSAAAPGSSRVAFVTPDAVYVGNPDGSGLRSLWASGCRPPGDESGRPCDAPSPPSWSPDSRTLAFVRVSGDAREIWLVHPDGTGERKLVVDGDRPAWSPDGRKIAFLRDWDIWVVDADGSNERRLTRTSVEESDPAWQPAFARGSANAWAHGRRAC